MESALVSHPVEKIQWEDLEKARMEIFEMQYPRITVDPAQMAGAPCIRHLRVPVATVVGMVADGMSGEEILESYPDLESEDIQEAHRYAAGGDLR
jgi:uncharacterized protein (DUF433 family)